MVKDYCPNSDFRCQHACLSLQSASYQSLNTPKTHNLLLGSNIEPREVRVQKKLGLGRGDFNSEKHQKFVL